MALTEQQIVDVLTILGLPVRTDITFAFMGDSQAMRDTEIVRKALQNTEAEQETRITGLITQWNGVQYDADRLNTQGLDSDPARTRRYYAMTMANLVGYMPRASTILTPMSFKIGRA